jgi:hypothetical protein
MTPTEMRALIAVVKSLDLDDYARRDAERLSFGSAGIHRLGDDSRWYDVRLIDEESRHTINLSIEQLQAALDTFQEIDAGDFERSSLRQLATDAKWFFSPDSIVETDEYDNMVTVGFSTAMTGDQVNFFQDDDDWEMVSIPAPSDCDATVRFEFVGER